MSIEYRIGADGKGHVYLDDERVWPGFTFTDAMRQAHDDGRKVMTRRLIKNIPENTLHFENWTAALTCIDAEPGTWGLRPVYAGGIHPVIFPRHQVDDLVYVKESLVCGGDSCAYYWSDQKPVIAYDTLLPWRWKRDRLPGIFMPGIAARRIDRIVEVRAEPLQDIPYQDKMAEGWNPKDNKAMINWFVDLWNSINPKRPWDSNPWVFVYRWEVVI